MKYILERKYKLTKLSYMDIDEEEIQMPQVGLYRRR